MPLPCILAAAICRITARDCGDFASKVFSAIASYSGRSFPNMLGHVENMLKIDCLIMILKENMQVIMLMFIREAANPVLNMM